MCWCQLKGFFIKRIKNWKNIFFPASTQEWQNEAVRRAEVEVKVFNVEVIVTKKYGSYGFGWQMQDKLERVNIKDGKFKYVGIWQETLLKHPRFWTPNFFLRKTKPSIN